MRTCCELIAFSTRREAHPLPEKFSPTSLLPNRELTEQVHSLDRALRSGALAVYFPSSPRSYLVNDVDLERTYGIAVLARLPDATVYGYAAPGAAGTNIIQ